MASLTPLKNIAALAQGLSVRLRTSDVTRNSNAPRAVARYLSSVQGNGPSTINEAEIRKFSRLADQWWRDADGPFAGLHQLNAVRVPLIRRALRHDGTGSVDIAGLPLAGVSVLDVGCGGGILSEALGRLGASVTGIDASSANVAAATAHSRLDPVIASRVQYRHTSVEALAATGVQYDGVVSSEVLEHVDNVDAFLSSACTLLRPGGHLVATTINRTAKSFLLAILGAEYVLRIVPAGTHEWAKFITPAELSSSLTALGMGMEVETVTGLFYSPLLRAWSMVNDTDVNYALVARKSEA